MKMLSLLIITMLMSQLFSEESSKPGGKINVQFLFQYAFVDSVVNQILTDQIILENITGKQTDEFNKMIKVKINGHLSALKESFANNGNNEYVLKFTKSANTTLRNLKDFANNNTAYKIDVNIIDELMKLKVE